VTGFKFLEREMMSTHKITFEISDAVMEMLKKRVPEQERNTFIEKSIHCMFSSMEQEKMLRDIIEHNKARDEELDAIDNSLEPDREDRMFKKIFTNANDFLDDDELFELDDTL